MKNRELIELLEKCPAGYKVVLHVYNVQQGLAEEVDVTGVIVDSGKVYFKYNLVETS
ncbi:hypothetical protein Elgi_37290 [Paenibacillus elgii]|uniref:hypothetical protein n=1 Tax=Paenibacillus elgii TaxID=189691 RepID=UPI002D7DCEC5|nr:hypothetical protein Elgi_37290 [Paenibacillus elgii]